MRVLMLGWELPPHNSGGLGVACYQLCRSLAAENADIEFILPYVADHGHVPFMKIRSALPQNVRSIQAAGMAYESYKYVMPDGTTKIVPLVEMSSDYEDVVAAYVTQTEFDVIHAHDWLTCRAAIRAKQLSGKPLILHMHSLEMYRSARAGGGNPVVREIESVALHIADKIVAISEHTKRAIIDEYNVPPDKIEVIHNGMDTDMLLSRTGDNAYTYLEHMRKEGWKVVSNVGRLTIQKGLTHLIQAMKIVMEHQPKTFLLFVGTGEQYTELIDLSAELGIADKVLFAGWQNGKKWRDAFAASDLFVMPSVAEPFGLTPLEAAAFGVPSLISYQSGVSEVLQSALKVDFWDVNAMANSIVVALRDQALCYELKDNAAKELDNLTWRPSAKKLMNLYRHQLAGTAV